MTPRLERVDHRLPRPLWAVALVIAWLGLIAAHEWRQAGRDDAATLCHFRRFTGVPCPSCGTTRAVLATARGDLVGAIVHNPFMMTALVLGTAWLGLRLFRRQLRLGLTVRQRRVAWSVVLVLFVANWGWVIAQHRV